VINYWVFELKDRLLIRREEWLKQNNNKKFKIKIKESKWKIKNKKESSKKS